MWCCSWTAPRTIATVAVKRKHNTNNISQTGYRGHDDDDEDHHHHAGDGDDDAAADDGMVMLAAVIKMMIWLMMAQPMKVTRVRMNLRGRRSRL